MDAVVKIEVRIKNTPKNLNAFNLAGLFLYTYTVYLYLKAIAAHDTII